MKRSISLFLALVLILSCFSVTVSASDAAFTDVMEGDYYYDAVQWAYRENITTGTTATTFSPEDPCTRAQIVTFLWRTQGCPEPASENNPFTDVPAGSFYEEPILWAFGEGITTGTTETTFSPEDPCTRGQIVTFLHRANGEPAAEETGNPFADVAAGAYYEAAVLWAYHGGITTGTTATTFSPENPCTRAQIATFLYRDHLNIPEETPPVDVCPDCAGNTDGMTFGYDIQYKQTGKTSGMPITFEAVFQLSEGDIVPSLMFPLDRRETYTETVLFSNDDTFEAAIAYSITEDGNPKISLRHKDWYRNFYNYVFDEVFVFSDSPVHLSIVLDQTARSAHCYIDGELKQTITNLSTNITKDFATTFPYAIGGDLYSGNPNYFRGTIYNLAVWSDLRTAGEIAADAVGNLDYNDSAMMAAYDLTRCENCILQDMSPAENHLKSEKLWQDEREVAPVGDYAYSFAVIGDTQELSEDDPSTLDALYDWIVENKDEHKIEYVLGLGDITQKSYDYEWEYVKPQIYKMNSVVPYLLARGNHDVLSDDFIKEGESSFNATFNDVFYAQQLTGVMTEGDMTCAYRTINICGTDYLFLTLDFGPTEEMLDWASQIVSAHPDHRVVVTTHAYLYRDGTTLDGNDAYPASVYPRNRDAALCQDGDDIWEKFASQHSNIVLVLSGHDAWQHIAYRQDKGVNGNTVTQMLIDPQGIDGFYEPTAMIAMFYFSEDGNTLTVRYYSAVKNMYGSETSQFTIDLS